MTIKRVRSQQPSFEGYGFEGLFTRLKTDPLDRIFEPKQYGNFIYQIDDRQTCFFGNFYTYSHVFNIITSDADLIAQLTAAIRANQRRADYLEQPDEVERQRQEEKAKHVKRAIMLDEQERRLTRELDSVKAARDGMQS